MRDLRKASGIVAAAGGITMLMAGTASAQSYYCYPDNWFSVTEGPNQNYDNGCGSTTLNGSVATVIGQPGSPFFTTVFQRMMAPRDENGGTAAPIGYAPEPRLPDTSPFASIDRIIEGRNADLATKAPAAAVPAADPSLFWVRGAGRYGNYDGVDGGPGAKLETGAIFAGFDLPVNESFRIGLAGGWSDSTFELDDNEGTLDASAWHASLYATAASGNWRAKGIVTYEYYDLDSRRPVGFDFDPGTARASYNADHVEALAEVSYFHFTGPNSAIEPYVSAGVSWVHVDGFTETGGGSADITAGAQDETWPYTLIGLRFVGAMNVNGVLVNPMLDLGWRHVFGDVDPNLIYSVEAGTLPVTGLPIAEDSLVVQAGFDAAFANGWRTSLKYKGDLAEEAQQHTLTGGVAVPF